jgi:EAL domain-containing protein (putative c-di-GMP-specific phosphodiesterase class I)
MKPTIGLLGFSPALLTTPANFSSVTGRGESGASISQLASLVMKQHSSENVHVFDPIIAETQEAAWQAQLQRVPFIATLYDSTGEGQTRAKWLNEIQQALQKNRFLLYAQPIVALSETEESAPLRFEVLLRLQRQDGSLAFPPDFLPIAEHLDLTCSIDLWVIRNTLTTLEELPQLAPRIAMCTINISGLSLIQPTFAEEVYRMVRASSFPAEKIGFEILENAMLSQMDQVRLFSEKMHSLGCSISLDDFGTGISSFAYLKSLSVDYVKIDGSFVCNLKPESVDYAIVDAIRRVSEHMSIPVVAEWVTTQEVQQYLRALGIDYGQGYLFGEPIELRKLLQQALRNSSSPQHSDGATRVGLSS